MRESLDAAQVISPWLLLPPLLVLALAALRRPAVPVLLAGAALGMALGSAFQGTAPDRLALDFLEGHKSASGHEAVDGLLSRGGMESMLPTILLILVATGMGGILERGGFLRVLLGAMASKVRGPGGLVTATVASSAGSNVLLSEQYLAIVMPGRLFRDAYASQGLAPRMLSRTLEDGGTVTSPLVPWNSCGAYMAGVLGVGTLAYLPYCFFNLAMPLLSVVFAWGGWFLLRAPAEEARGE